MLFRLGISFKYIALHLAILFRNSLLNQFLNKKIINELFVFICLFNFSPRHRSFSNLISNKRCGRDVNQIIFICYLLAKTGSAAVRSPYYNNSCIFPWANASEFDLKTSLNCIYAYTLIWWSIYYSSIIVPPLISK